jgi:hypothetical protein
MYLDISLFNYRILTTQLWLPDFFPKLCSPVVFIVDIMSDILEVLHVGLDEEPPEVGEVAVLRVLNVHQAPGILPPSDTLPPNLATEI